MSETPISRAKARAATVRQRRGGRLSESPLTAPDKASMDWRSAQAQADADIEGLARDPGAEALIADMERAGVPLDQQRARLIAYFRGEDPQALAAE